MLNLSHNFEKMKKMKILLLSTLAVIFMLSAGCKKDKKDATCSLNSNAFEGSYKITSATFQIGNLPEENIFDTEFDVCEKDDIYSFGANSVFTLTDAGIICDPTNSATGTWGLNGNILTFSDGDILAGTISNFSCNSFQVSFIEVGGALKLTFTRQ